MRLKITHTTSYHYEAPVPYALQQLRLRPKSRPEQTVMSWTIEIDGGRRQVRFEDEHANMVDLVSVDAGATDIVVRCEGEVEMRDNHGVLGRHTGFAPLWLFRRATPLTEAGAGVRSLLGGLVLPDEALPALHALSAQILAVLPYSTEQKDVGLSAEQTLSGGHAVCQDHAHVFIAAARELGFPARYVSGYLLTEGREDQSASHAWAEAHVENLGWVGFDVSNGISPDIRYVRVATGLDYLGAAPVSGMRFGGAAENMLVKLRVEQQ